MSEPATTYQELIYEVSDQIATDRSSRAGGPALSQGPRRTREG